jgi:hypothetical protein
MKRSIRALQSWLFTPGNKAGRFSRAAEVHAGSRVGTKSGTDLKPFFPSLGPLGLTAWNRSLASVSNTSPTTMRNTCSR